MGTLLSNNSKEPKTEAISYTCIWLFSIMLPHYPYTFPDLIKEISTYFSDNYTDFD